MFDDKVNYTILVNNANKEFMEQFKEYSIIGSNMSFDELKEKLEMFPSKRVVFNESWYNLRNNEIVNILYGKFGEPQFASQGGYAIPNGIMGYSDIHVGNDAIYAVFWGTSFKDIQKDPFNTKEGGNIIQVFSLEGKPLKQYTLDRHITGFSIDEESNKMIALDVNSDNQIVEYQL